MHIVNVISSLGYGGAETQVIKLSNELVSQGNKVTVVTTNSNNPRLHLLDNSGVEVVSLDKRSKIDLRLLVALRRLLAQLRPDVIHAYLYDAEFYSRLASIGLGIPLINSERNDNYILNRLQKLGNRLTAWLADGVIANSFAGKAHAAQTYPALAPANLHVVYNGIDIKEVDDRIGADDHDYRLEWFGISSVEVAVMVGAIKPQKNHAFALEVAESLIANNPEWRVVFIGGKLDSDTGAYLREIQCTYSRDKNKEKILFLENRDDVLEILSQASISFLTSKHEGFPNVVLESMAVGTPVVTTCFSDIRKILPEPWQVQSEGPAEFSAAIIRAFKEREDLSTRGRAWVEENCSITIAAQNLLETYRIYLGGARF